MKKRRGRSTKKKTIKVPSSSSSLQSIQHPLYNSGNNLVDRISDLPDDLLRHILSFLPTIQAFTTTSLSKRWTTIFYSLPVLYFNNESIKGYKTLLRFCRFVDTITFSPLSTNKPLKTFRLINCWFGNYRHCDCSIFDNCLASWLEGAKQRHVEEIHLSLYDYTLNPIIFISRTLVVLKLEWLKLDIDTSCVDLPSLKTLLLKYVSFENRKDYINFLSACPILQDLHAESISICSDINLDENNAPKAGGFKSLILSELVRASIDSMDALFNIIDNVEFLHLTIAFEHRPLMASFNAIPLFRNLIHCELLFGFCSFYCWNGVVELLRCCPKLEILFIKTWTMTSSSKEWKCPISVLECVSSHLRSCTILNFQGSTNDLRFATYIFQNARLLQDMTIGVNSDRMLSEKSQIIEELSSCPRISLGCKLSFEFKNSY